MPQNPPWSNWKQTKNVWFHQNFNKLEEESNESKSISELSSKDSHSDKKIVNNKIKLPNLSNKDINCVTRKSKNALKLSDILKPKNIIGNWQPQLSRWINSQLLNSKSWGQASAGQKLNEIVMSLRRKFIVLKVKAFGPDEYDPAAIITEVLSLAHELRVMLQLIIFRKLFSKKISTLFHSQTNRHEQSSTSKRNLLDIS